MFCYDNLSLPIDQIFICIWKISSLITIFILDWTAAHTTPSNKIQNLIIIRDVENTFPISQLTPSASQPGALEQEFIFIIPNECKSWSVQLFIPSWTDNSPGWVHLKLCQIWEWAERCPQELHRIPGMSFPTSSDPTGAEAAQPWALLLSLKIPTFPPKHGHGFAALKILWCSNGKFHQFQGRKLEELSWTKGAFTLQNKCHPLLFPFFFYFLSFTFSDETENKPTWTFAKGEEMGKF